MMRCSKSDRNDEGLLSENCISILVSVRDLYELFDEFVYISF